MDDINLKQRLVGAVVLVSLAVIFIPMILDGRDPTVNYITKSNIPPKPERDFVSRVIPLNPSPVPQPELLSEAPAVETGLQVDDTPPAETDTETPAEAPAAPKPVAKPKPEAVVAAKPEIVVKPKTGLSAWAVQVGSFSSKENAYALRDKLRKQGFTVFVDTIYSKDTPVFRVRVGPEIKREQADALQAKLAKQLKARPIVVQHP
ncbi:SPOR domain-containing protein [Sulfuriflexus sp.]|uniref:SPOR domain-containing protein n=1 Tax=Sulfuriflexus sp. TaxID=2015443 RepID=UPI0028CDB5BF|nr:SPOR domain-containing protein [Sulfuriflexus sp.]MDT8403382.1 SPOR domain-containing protein [Sulfuriflexus sp.]